MKLLYTLIILFAFLFAEDKLNIKDKTWSAQAGFGTRQSLGTVGISKDFMITEKISSYLIIGFPTASVGISFSNS